MVLKLGDCSDTLITLREMLTFLGFGYVGQNPQEASRKADLLYLPTDPSVASYFDTDLRSAVVAFQREEHLFADGLVGPITLDKLEDAYARRARELNSPGLAAATVEEFVRDEDGRVLTPKLYFKRVEADKNPFGPGYEKGMLRVDAAEAYSKVREEAQKQGAILTSHHMLRALDAPVNDARRRTSMHYLGRALDLHLFNGMVDPETDPYVVVWADDRNAENALPAAISQKESAVSAKGKSDDTRTDMEKKSRTSGDRSSPFIVYARCGIAHRKKADLPPTLKLEDPITYASLDARTAALKERKSDKTAPSVTGHFLNLTDLMARHGFKPIPPRPGFDTGRSRLLTEWWHFQYETGLIPYATTFGSELERVYAPTALEGTEPWKYRHRIWMLDWI